MLKFELGDWRTNASLLGLIRILEHNNRKYSIEEGSIEFSSDILDGFEEDYFNFFSDTYEKHLPWYRIISYGEKLDGHLDNPAEIDKESLETLNDQIGLVKDYLRRNNYIKVYPLIKGADGLDEKAKDIQKINLRKNEEVEDRLEDIIIEMERLREIINICDSDDAKKHMRAKGVIYNYINRGIGGISFLFRQTKFIDVFEDYRAYFIEPLKKNLENESKANNPYECFSCGNAIDTIGNSYTINLINNTGFDDTRKSSYVWNHMSDILICPKCNFLFSMMAAGFNYSAYEGIFINYSRNIEGLRYSNDSAKAKIINMTNNERGVSYRTIVAAVGRQHIEDLEYEESDIQIIRYKDDNYNFNILSREIINVIKRTKGDLQAIENAAYKQGNDYFSIYDQVLDRIFNGQNMFGLLHFLLVNMISKNPGVSAFYNAYHIGRINNINYEIMIGGMNVGKIDMKKQIYFSRRDGNILREEYLKKGMESKISGISYRLLNALKTRNSETFMHNIINSYMYLNKAVPQNITLALEDEEKLGLIGYAFVTGLNGFKDNEASDNKNEKEME